MARYKGIFKASANYEPQIAAPFDARSLVETKSDLILDSTWRQSDGGIWTYVGMIVSVAKDIDPNNNGVYILIADDFTLASNWRKLSDENDIDSLREEINNIVSNGDLDVEVEAEADLPEIGVKDVTYYVKENYSIRRWNAETQSYDSYGGTNADLPDINLIFGGNSNGND